MKKYFKVYSIILFLSFMSVLNVYATENPVFRYRISDVNSDQSSSDEDNGKLSISIPVSSRVRTNVQYALKLGDIASVSYSNWSIYSGVLPSGLSLNALTGEISGLPLDNITNDYPIKIKVQDSNGNFGISNTLTLMLLKSPTISIDSPKIYSAGDSISITPITTDTYGSRIFSINSKLPYGVFLDSTTGKISGKTYQTGLFSYKLTVTDSDGATATTGNANIEIDGDLNISGYNFPVNIRQEQNYVSALPYVNTILGSATWSIVDGNLPDGISINSSNGQIGGIPTKAGTYSFLVQAKYSDDSIAVGGEYTINVYSEGITVSVPNIIKREGTYSNYSVSVLNIIGKPVYSLNKGTLNNLVLSTDGNIYGSMGSSGTYNDNIIKVVDSNDGTVGYSNSFNIVSWPELKIGLPTFPSIKYGKTFTIPAPTAIGVYSSAVWSSDGDLPNGLTMNSDGSITGTISSYGTFLISYQLTDTWDNQTVVASQYFTIADENKYVSSISNKEIPINEYYSTSSLTVNPKDSEVVYTLASGNLPDGLFLNGSTGSIAGTPTVAGEYAGLSIKATFSDNGIATTNSFKITVDSSSENGQISVKMPCITCNAVINVQTSFGTPTVNNASGSRTWSLVGNYPSWVILDSSTGEISGTATDIGTYSGLQLKLTVNNVDYYSDTFSIVATYGPNITISGLSSKTYTVGNTVATNTPIIDNNVGTYTFSLTGTLPSGLSFDNTTGVITGTATTAGIYGPYNITVTDSENRSSTSDPFYINIYDADPLSVTISGVTSFTSSNQTVNIIATTLYARGTVVYELHGDNLPAWLTIDISTGNISGTTPSESAIINNVYVTARDSYGQTSTSNKLDIIVSTLSIDNIADQTVYKNVAFNISAPNVTGSYGTVTYSLLNSPEWLVVNSNTGILSGTPISTGSWSISYQVKDSIGTKTIDFNLTSNGLVINNQVDSQIHVNNSFSTNAPSVTGATNSLVWSVYYGSLPKGLTLDSSTGIISGKPTVSGTYSLNLKATDSVTGTYSATNVFKIEVLDALNVGNITTYFVGYVQSSFQNTQLKAYNAVGNVTWTVQSGTFPSWLTLNSSNGVITGKPENTFYSNDIVFRATDSSGAYVDTPKITIAVFNHLEVTTSSQYYTSRVGDSLDIAFTYNGVSTAPTWSVTSGSIPTGMSFNTATGEITGIVSATGYYTFTVSAYHEESLQTVDLNIVVVVSPTLSMSLNPTTYSVVIGKYLSTSTPTIGGNVGQISYSYTGTLLNDIGFDSSTGIFSGLVPTQSSLEGNEYILQLTAKDSFDLATKNVNVTIDIASPYDKLALSDFSIPNLGINTSYVFTSQPVATGGNGTYLYSISSQSSGSGLTINSSTGVLSGTPTTSGNKSATITVTDSDGRSLSVTKTFTVYSVLSLESPVFGTSTALSPVVVTNQPSASGGTGTYEWSLSGNPSWMAIDSSTGIITGTPDTVGTFTTKVTVVSGNQTKTSSIISGTVQTPTITLASTTFASKLTTDVLSQDFKTFLMTTGVYDTSTIVWSSTNLPTGLTVNASNGIVSGTISTTGTYTYTITATLTINGVNYVGSQSYSLQIISQNMIVNMSAGFNHNCAVTIAGGLKCWGQGTSGQLGNGTTTNSTTPVDVSGLLTGAANVSSGNNPTCTVTTSGSVKCWGYNYFGSVSGVITANGSNYTTPVALSNLTSGVSNISAGDSHVCVITTSGGAKCWGYNTSGQLGNGTIGNSGSPVDVYGLTSDVISISAGYSHTCAVTTAGAVKCWGDNTYGQLGNGGTVTSYKPVSVSGLTSGVISVTSGYQYSCALLSTGSIKCWGNDKWGQLGNGTSGSNNYYTSPVSVLNITNAVNISASDTPDQSHTCAVLSTGGAKCWGYDGYGEIGNGVKNTSYGYASPVDVSGLTSGVSSISTGYSHTCAVLTSGGVKCWGSNTYGQLGNGTTTASYTPVTVSNLQ